MADYKKAVKNRYRYDIGKGAYSTEDLFDLPLETLDTLAQSLDKEISAANTTSYIANKRATSTLELENKRDIVVDVIRTKEADAEAKEFRKNKEATRQRIKDILLQNKLKEEESKSNEELEAMLAELED